MILKQMMEVRLTLKKKSKKLMNGSAESPLSKKCL